MAHSTNSALSVHDEHDLANVAVALHILVGGSRADRMALAAD